MDARFGLPEPGDPWRGRQPKYERLVMRRADQFALTARLPSGERIDVAAIRAKLGARTRGEAGAQALGLGLLG